MKVVSRRNGNVRVSAEQGLIISLSRLDIGEDVLILMNTNSTIYYMDDGSVTVDARAILRRKAPRELFEYAEGGSFKVSAEEAQEFETRMTDAGVVGQRWDVQDE